MTKPFLILQLRPEAEAADDEFAAFLAKGGLAPDEVQRIRLDCEDLPESLDLADYSGVIVGGGPGCVSDAESEKSPVEKKIEDTVLSLMPAITAQDKPFLGCCYGIGILGAHLGGVVSKERYGEPVGAADCTLTEEGAKDPLLAGMPPRFQALVGHKEAMQALPDGCVHLVSAPTCPYQMVRHGRNVYATQFHPEADGEGFALRIRIYRNKGYFPPEEADALTERVLATPAKEPARILANFVSRYREG
ncbi:GMP synthase [glutamine-hydrolyzing] [Pseudoruegeria aquimaris]|uniref:GMP synthase [glutamine-hydrolyzing] n=1 Tax=Pseudoruegeria aquimaris TaxID=393663 RepID=A0A1Y5SFS5_9RHOB|nr:glutamine amidotransferase [Pseudoruegeria aquimaris]SLN39415.1 GMP synthase [glutamine-hydrolyzing] [Pseudoruegeria aquimaris]